MKPMKAAITGVALLLLAGCATTETEIPTQPPAPVVSPEVQAMYGAVNDNGHHIAAVDPNLLTEDKTRRQVDYWSKEKPGTIIVDPYAKFLYQVQPNNKAMRYTVAVGAAGYGFAGEAHIPYQRDWPSWKPTDNMIANNPELYGPVEKGLEGGVDNPMGARALYLHNSKGDTFYRIHGTMDPSSIGSSDTAGCIRLFNQDIIHLADQTNSMAKVIVLSEAQSGQGTVPPGQAPQVMAASTPDPTRGPT